MTETTPLSGKNTWSSGLSASIRTCSRWQGTCSSSGKSCLRLRDGRASKRRLRGQFDGELMPQNDARFASVPENEARMGRFCHCGAILWLSPSRLLEERVALRPHLDIVL